MGVPAACELQVAASCCPNCCLALHPGLNEEHSAVQCQLLANICRACRDQFEKAETHDDLWNAAQKQMTQHGKMHGFMRMVRASLMPSLHACASACPE